MAAVRCISPRILNRWTNHPCHRLTRADMDRSFRHPVGRLDKLLAIAKSRHLDDKARTVAMPL